MFFAILILLVWHQNQIALTFWQSIQDCAYYSWEHILINAGDENKLLYESLSNLIDCVTYISSSDRSRFLSINSKIARWINGDPSLFMSNPLRYYDYIHPEDRARYLKSITNDVDELFIKYRILSGGSVFMVHDKSVRIHDVNGCPLLTHGTLNITLMSDIVILDKRHEPHNVIQLYSDKIPYTYDVVTGLPDRQCFFSQIGVFESFHNGHVFWIGVSGISKVNEHFGVCGGDAVLSELKTRLLSIMPKDVFAARVAATEFAVIAKGLFSDADAMLLANSLLSLLTSPFHMNGNEFETVKVAIGIASFSTGGMIEDAIDNANIAYREVKYSKTESVALFNNHIQTKRFHSIMIEKSLRHSVTNNLIIPFFQPKVNANGVLSGYESLARLYDNDGRLIMPGDFIAVAEDTGLIVNLGDWMLEESYRQLNETRLLLGHPEKLSLAFNVSANQLFGNSILNTFQRTCVNNDRFSLELEITENVFVDWSSNISKLLDKFRCDGALIVLDDFGTGYSSLSYISKYSVDIVKLDRNFIIGIEHDLAQRKLVEAIIKLAHSLSILVVAEGIETEEQRRLVVDMGVDEMQGYLFGRPMPIELLELPGVRKE